TASVSAQAATEMALRRERPDEEANMTEGRGSAGTKKAARSVERAAAEKPTGLVLREAQARCARRRRVTTRPPTKAEASSAKVEGSGMAAWVMETSPKVAMARSGTLVPLLAPRPKRDTMSSPEVRPASVKLNRLPVIVFALTWVADRPLERKLPVKVAPVIESVQVAPAPSMV